MTREETKKLLPILVAFSEGKKIEVRQKDVTDPDAPNDWVEMKDFSIWLNTEYRIKPEPKYRPFKDAEECWTEMLKHYPVGWLKAIPNKEYEAKYYPNVDKSINLYYHIQKVAPGYIKYDDVDDFCELVEKDKEYKDVFEVMTFADGSVFGKLEEE